MANEYKAKHEIRFLGGSQWLPVMPYADGASCLDVAIQALAIDAGTGVYGVAELGFAPGMYRGRTFDDRWTKTVAVREIDPLASAVAGAERDHPLPRCQHGRALRDGSGERLEPPCGC